VDNSALSVTPAERLQATARQRGIGWLRLALDEVGLDLVDFGWRSCGARSVEGV
jgi:hypothetical protein